MVECLCIVDVIFEVCVYGDLLENVEYYVVKEVQSFNEGWIVELEDKLLCVEVIDVIKLFGDMVKFGVMVFLIDEDMEEEKNYMIVGDVEFDVKQNKVLIFFFIVCVLIGKSIGDSVEVVVLGGVWFYEIVGVCFGQFGKIC